MKQIAAAACLSLSLLGGTAAQKYESHFGKVNWYQFLNVDHNIGLRHVDGTIKGLKYSRDCYDWGDLGRFKYFTAEIFRKNDGTSTLMWWVSDHENKKLSAVEKDKTFIVNDSEVGEWPGDGLVDLFYIRRAKSVTDNHGGRPAYLTAKLGDQECALTFADPGDEIYSKTTLKCFNDASELDSWNRLYLARTVPFYSEGEVWDWAKQDSTFYFFNQWSRDTLTTEKNEHHKIGRSGEWGDFNRFTLVQRGKPFFDMYNYSKRTRDKTIEGSDYRVRTQNHELTIGLGGTVGWKYAGSGNDHVWCYLRNSVDGKKMYYSNGDGYIKDKGDGSDSPDKWQMLRVWNDAAYISESTASDL